MQYYFFFYRFDTLYTFLVVLLNYFTLFLFPY